MDKLLKPLGQNHTIAKYASYLSIWDYTYSIEYQAILLDNQSLSLLGYQGSSNSNSHKIADNFNFKLSSLAIFVSNQGPALQLPV